MLLAAVVTISGRGLYVDGKAFFIRGVGYQPIPVGYDYSYRWWERPDIYMQDLKLMKEMGVNTIKLWTALPEEGEDFLDACYNYGIYVMMTYYPPDTGWSDAATREQRKEGFLEIVERWKDHPAILMWIVGNEHNYRVDDEAGWYQFVEDCALAVKSVDPGHPVTTANGEIGNILNYDSLVPDLGCWGANVYRGSSFSTLFSDYEKYSDKPFWFSEFGCDAINGVEEDQEGQAECVLNLWTEIEKNSFLKGGVCIGGCIMAWSDEWWKAGNYSMHDLGGGYGPDPKDDFFNEEWWGIVDVYRNPRQVYYSLKSLWNPAGTTALPSSSVGDFTVYPNPFSESFKILYVGESKSVFTAYLYNVYGQRLAKIADGEQLYTGECLEISLKEFPSGMYIVVIKDEESGKRMVLKVYKKE